MSKYLCKGCDTVLESRHVHDWQQCPCLNESFVDGGGEYARVGGRDLTLIVPLNDDGTEKRKGTA